MMPSESDTTAQYKKVVLRRFGRDPNAFGVIGSAVTGSWPP